MLLLSDAKITIGQPGDVRVEGRWKRYSARIRQFVADLGLTHATVRHRFGRFVFSSGVDPGTRQRFRNFLVNECRMLRK